MRNKRRYSLDLINLTIKCIPLLLMTICFLIIHCLLVEKNECEDPVLTEMIWAKHENPKAILFNSSKEGTCLTSKWTIAYIRKNFEKPKTIWAKNKDSVFKFENVTKMRCDTETNKRIVYINDEIFYINKNNGCGFEGELSNYNPKIYEEYLMSRKPQCICEIQE